MDDQSAQKNKEIRVNGDQTERVDAEPLKVVESRCEIKAMCRVGVRKDGFSEISVLMRWSKVTLWLWDPKHIPTSHLELLQNVNLDVESCENVFIFWLNSAEYVSVLSSDMVLCQCAFSLLLCRKAVCIHIGTSLPYRLVLILI